MCAINFNVATHTLFIIIDRWWCLQSARHAKPKRLIKYKYDLSTNQVGPKVN